MSWNQAQPQQRYSAVPGFERQGTPTSSVLPTPPPRAAELPRSGSGNDIYSGTPPPAHRTSEIYSDPFTGDSASQANLPRGDSINNMHSQGHAPRSAYTQMGDGGYGAAGAGAGAGAGAAAAAGYSAAHQGYPTQQGYNPTAAYDNDHGFSARDNVPSDQLWARDVGKERVPNYDHDVGDESSGKSKKKWWIFGIIALIIIACAVAIPIGVTQANKGKNNNSSGSGHSTNGTGLENPNDPSKFTTDPRLHKVFWGMAYQPDGVIPPMCGATQDAINKDMQILSQLTSRLRLYGGNCNCTIMVMEAIKQTKVDMEVYPAIYLDDNNEQAFTDQLHDVVSAFKTYGVDKIGGLAVGNEYLLGAGINSPSGAKYQKGLASLQAHIKTVNETILGLSLDKHVPIGTGDAGSLMSVALGEMVDFFMANVHPWFGGVPVSEAADWTYSYFQETDVAPAMQASNQPMTYIAETGWPTAYMTPPPGGETQASGADPSHATAAELQVFLDSYVCQANANGTGYFYFEPFDQPWKNQYGGVEPFWGLFDKDRNLKQITIPTC